MKAFIYDEGDRDVGISPTEIEIKINVRLEDFRDDLSLIEKELVDMFRKWFDLIGNVEVIWDEGKFF